ncbi:hypothetical protein D3C71_1584170 [compost metagenome]
MTSQKQRFGLVMNILIAQRGTARRGIDLQKQLAHPVMKVLRVGAPFGNALGNQRVDGRQLLAMLGHAGEPTGNRERNKHLPIARLGKLGDRALQQVTVGRQRRSKHTA